MSILLIGVNHRTAPVELREKLAFSQQGIATTLLMFRRRYPETEIALLSTCNRVEMILSAPQACPARQELVQFVSEARDLPVSEFHPYLYEYRDEEAVRHILRVTSGLDSMVFGENHIVGQVKRAYTQASEQGTAGPVLNRLFHHAFAVSKQIRTETRISEGNTSIPALAVQQARQLFPNCHEKHILVIGAGEMAQLVCEYLQSAEPCNFAVTSRTDVNARALARAYNGTAVPYAELDAYLGEADIVMSATNCPKQILTTARVRAALENRPRSMLFVDLAVPRDVEPAVRQIDLVHVCDIDMLGKLADANRTRREGELDKCERILDKAIGSFEAWYVESRAKPLIQQLFSDARKLATLEIERVLGRCPDLTESERAAVTELADRLVNKLMHPCVYTVRRHSDAASITTLTDTLHDVTCRQSKLYAAKRRTSQKQTLSAVN